jgi:hypothetical protein
MPGLKAGDLSRPMTLKTQRHLMPEWGEDAYVTLRALSSRDLIELRKSFAGEITKEHGLAFTSAVLYYSVVDDDGNRVLTSHEEALSQRPEFINELGEAALKLSGLWTPDAKKN